MAIRIVTDSTADLSKEDAALNQIEVVPLKLMFQEETYLDGISLTNDEFYKMLDECSNLPTTSQPTPNDYIEVFEKAKEANDDLICITLSSALSGTYQSAMLAKGIVDYDRIFIVDSLQAATSLQLLVLIARQRVNENKKTEEIVAEINELKHKVTLKAILFTLDNLVKGGRLSKTAGFAGSLLSIRPIITVLDGKIEVVTKARGKKASMEALYNEMMKDGEIDHDLPMLLAYTKDKSNAVDLQEYLFTKDINIDGICPIGAVIGTHAGPNASAIAYFKK